MKRVSEILPVAFMVWAFFLADSAHAQRTTQSRSSTGSSSLSNGSSFPSSGNSALGSGLGINQQTGLNGLNQSQMNGPVGTRNTNQGLVGTNNFGQTTGNRRTTTNRRGGGARNQQGFNNGMNGFGPQNFNNGNFNQNIGNAGMVRRTIQPQHRVAFPFAGPAPSAVHAKIEKILTPASQSKLHVRNLRIETAGDGIVTLHGDVSSEHHKQLAGMMAQFEPGVRQVRNELTVRNPESSPESSDQ